MEACRRGIRPSSTEEPPWDLENVDMKYITEEDWGKGPYVGTNLSNKVVPQKDTFKKELRDPLKGQRSKPL